MADIADFGLMIWDGRSPGTILNVLRLVRAHKITVLFNAAEQSTTNVKGANDWRELVKRFPVDVFRAVRQRATDQEWLGDCGSATTIRASTGDSFPASHQRSA
jgi:adenine-specific DNA-methyltransferase